MTLLITPGYAYGSVVGLRSGQSPVTGRQVNVQYSCSELCVRINLV